MISYAKKCFYLSIAHASAAICSGVSFGFFSADRTFAAHSIAVNAVRMYFIAGSLS